MSLLDGAQGSFSSSFEPLSALVLPPMDTLTGTLGSVLASQLLASDGILATFITSGPMAILVAGILIMLSVASWSIIVRRVLQLRKASKHSQKFLAVFRNSKRFSEVSNWADQLYASPLVSIFQTGYVEIDAQIKTGSPQGQQPSTKLKSFDSLHRSLRRALSEEILRLSRGGGFLATTAAAAPFIGLFGTVWGIMNAFGDIAATGSTSLVAVAPGIAEALVNTALGLVAAIPALIGYNFLNNELRRLRAQMDDFILEFLNLAERNFT